KSNLPAAYPQMHKPLMKTIKETASRLSLRKFHQPHAIPKIPIQAINTKRQGGRKRLRLELSSLPAERPLLRVSMLGSLTKCGARCRPKVAYNGKLRSMPSELGSDWNLLHKSQLVP